MAKKKKYSIEGCIGCGICISANSQIFRYNKTGLAEINSENADKDVVIEISKQCPSGAIKINF